MARVAVLVLGLSGILLMGHVSAFTPCVGDGSVFIGGTECFSVFYNPMKTPVDAEAACQALPTSALPQVIPASHLATIKSAEENGVLLKLIQEISLIAIIGFKPMPLPGAWVDPAQPAVVAGTTYTNVASDSNTVSLCSSDSSTYTYMCKVDGQWHQNCGVRLPYVCRTQAINPCAPPFASPGWSNVNNRCFKLLTSKERKGAEFLCAGLESQGEAVMYDFNDSTSFVNNVLTTLSTMPGPNQQKQFWLDVSPIYDPKFNNDNYYRDYRDYDGFKGPDYYKGYGGGYNDKGYGGGYNDKGYGKGYDKGYDLKKVTYYNQGPPKCLAGVVKGGSTPKFFVEKESCKNEYNVICELKALPPVQTPPASG